MSPLTIRIQVVQCPLEAKYISFPQSQVLFTPSTVLSPDLLPNSSPELPYSVLLKESRAVSNGLRRKWGQGKTNKEMIGAQGRMSYRPAWKPDRWENVCAHIIHTRQEQPKLNS